MGKNPYTPLPIRRAGARLIASPACAHIAYQEKKFSDYASFFPLPSAPKRKNTVIYRIYRNACRNTDHALFVRRGLRYDLTILPSRTMADTYPTRTIGHVHRLQPRQRLPYPEMYEVIEGTALFIMENKTHTVVRCARLSAGEKIIIPPNDGHITVNASRTQPLVVANIFTTAPDIADYSFFKARRGPSWEPRWQSGALVMKKNPRARPAVRCIRVVPKLPASLAQPREKMYAAFLKHPAAFDFLSNPEHHRPLLAHHALFSTERNASHGR
jgi:glucose-6-phosphate isomerase